jgi:hypothetical protein
VFQVNLLDEAWAAAAAMPFDLRKVFDEFPDLLELEPHTGELYPSAGR